jgi:hypothetical protein
MTRFVFKEDPMFRQLFPVGLGLISLISLGCREEATKGPVDLAHPSPHDMGDNNPTGTVDMAMQIPMTSTTPHDIDTNAVAAGTKVSLTGLVITSPVKRHLSSSGYCEYRVFAQDPACTASAAPCGIELYDRGTKLAVLDASGKDCPYADASDSKTVFSVIKEYGDIVDVTGSVKSFPDQTAPMTVVMHSVSVDTLTFKSKGSLPTAIPVTDSATSIFAPHSGSGWNTYEGTYIKLSPPSGMFTTSATDSHDDFTVTPGGAMFGTSFYYGPKDLGGNTFPETGAQFSSISGVVDNDYGGVIQPILPTDYAQ